MVKYKQVKRKKLLASPYVELFWNEFKINPERDDYNIIIDQRIEGNIDIDRLRASLKYLVEDYFILNSHLIREDGVLYWEQNNEINLLHVFDDVVLQEKFVHKLFNLETGPLYRFGLFQVGPNHYDLIIVFHHAVVDGASAKVLYDIVSQYYNDPYALRVDLNEQLNRVGELNQCLQEDVNHLQKINQETQYWQSKLKDLPAKTELNYTQNEIGDRVGELAFAIEHNDLLSTWLKRNRTTPFIFFMSCWGILIARYSNSDKAAISYPVGIQEGSAFEYGANVNTVLFPVMVNPTMTFDDIIQNANQSVKSYKIDTLRYDRLPISDIVRDCPVKQLNVAFTLADLKALTFNFEGCHVTACNRYNIDISGAELSLQYEKKGERYQFKLLYRADLFGVSYVENMMAHYRYLLEQAVENSHQVPVQLDLLQAEMHQRIVYDWNETKHPYPQNQTMTALFELKANDFPDRVAIVFENQQITYGRLNATANQLARWLQRSGLCMGDLVVVTMEKSIDFIAVLLATHKAGAAFVPVDSSLPLARISAIIDETHPKYIFWDANCSYHDEMGFEGGGNAHAKQITFDDAFVSVFSDESDEDLNVITSPTSLAYIIFTSGSTGKPKGVMVNHQACVNLIHWVNKTFNVCAKDRLAFVTSISFDLAIYDIFGILAAGAQIYIPAPAVRKSPEALLNFLHHNEITFWDSAPQALQQLMLLPECNNNNQRRALALRLVFLSGDWIPLELPSAIKQRSPQAEVISLGGATEATIWSNYFVVSEVQDHWRSIPYGKPIHNMKYYILDKNLLPVPLGVCGDLYIAGVGLSDGYYKNHELTKAHFIQNPYAPGWMYKTNDLARYFPDGNIEFIGRCDGYIKIRGYRIELSEITATVSKYKETHQAVTVIKEQGSSQFIHCYVVRYKNPEKPMHVEDEIFISYLRRYLTSILPAYMQPDKIVVVKAIPLTANGKVDYKALATMQSEPVVPRLSHHPLTEIEAALLTIWQKVLS